MRRIPVLLCVAGLAAAPASAVAGPSKDPWSTGPSPTVETFSWSTSRGRLGVMVMSLTPELRKHFGAPEDRGVLVAQVAPGTPVAKAGIEVGDVIVEVRGRKIDAAPDVLSAIGDVGKGEHVKLTLVRERASRSVEATLTSPAMGWDTDGTMFDWFRTLRERFAPKA
jgi:membrane-associated protease RseP (regulator of RpoE activity)